MALIFPGDPLFNISLSKLPPGWQNSRSDNPKFVCRSGGFGMLEQVGDREFQEYIHGGEFQERLIEIKDEEEDIIYFDL